MSTHITIIIYTHDSMYTVSSALDARHKLSVLTESDLRIAVKDTIVQVTRGIYIVYTSSGNFSIRTPINSTL